MTSVDISSALTYAVAAMLVEFDATVMAFERKDENAMDETLGLALASFTAAALSAAEESCEMRFRQAALEFLARLKRKVTQTSTQRLQLEVRKPPSLHQTRLWRLLRHLPSQDRRKFIEERLSEAERQQLEHELLAERARQGSLALALPSCVSLRSLCRWKGRARCRVGYRPILHLHDSLYAQASFTFNLATAVRAFGILLAMRAAAEEEAMTVEKMQHAIAHVQRAAGAHIFYFKTRVKLTSTLNSHRREVATPARRSLHLALREWQSAQLLRAEAAVITGRADRVTREALECCKRQKTGTVPWLKEPAGKRKRRARSEAHSEAAVAKAQRGLKQLTSPCAFRSGSN
eukprot:s607_g10.t1